MNTAGWANGLWWFMGKADTKNDSNKLGLPSLNLVKKSLSLGLAKMNFGPTNWNIKLMHPVSS